MFVDICSIAAWNEGDELCTIRENGATLRIPVPTDLVPWAEKMRDRLIANFAQRDVGITQLAEELRDRIGEYGSRYEDMWLEMVIEPKWALRSDWLDAATIAIPELKQTGYRFIRFLPLEPFPNFRVQFAKDRVGRGQHIIQMDLEPSDLILIANGDVMPGREILHWVDRLLAFVAVQTVWMIVMGKLPRTERGGHRASGNGGAVVRSRFRRLPNGQCASEGARMRALEQFRREPLPGFTFVREYQRGLEIHSGEPLFSVSIVDIES